MGPDVLVQQVGGGAVVVVEEQHQSPRARSTARFFAALRPEWSMRVHVSGSRDGEAPQHARRVSGSCRAVVHHDHLELGRRKRLVAEALEARREQRRPLVGRDQRR